MWGLWGSWEVSEGSWEVSGGSWEVSGRLKRGHGRSPGGYKMLIANAIAEQRLYPSFFGSDIWVKSESNLSPMKTKQEHKVSYRCSLPSPLQKGSKDWEVLIRLIHKWDHAIYQKLPKIWNHDICLPALQHIMTHEKSFVTFYMDTSGENLLKNQLPSDYD